MIFWSCPYPEFMCVHVRTHMDIRLAHRLVDDCVFESHKHGDVKPMMLTHAINMELEWPNMRHGNYTCSSLSTKVYILSLYLKLSHVIEMWIDLCRGYQTLNHKMVVIKVAFEFVVKYDARHDQSIWDFPMSMLEIYLGSSSDRTHKCMAMLDKVKI
jgi:hypothetical protein